MCKTPGCECKPMEEDIPIGDNNVVNEEEIEPLDSESFYTESSSEDGESESDAESASGNRVTKDMVVFLMLKENNVVSEEWYAQKVESTTDDIKSLFPKLSKSGDDDDDDSVDIKDRSSFEDLFEQLLAEKEKGQSTGNKDSESQEESNTEEGTSQEASDDNKIVKRDADLEGKAVSEDQSKGYDINLLQKDTTVGFSEKNERTTTIIEQQETKTKIKDVTESVESTNAPIKEDQDRNKPHNSKDLEEPKSKKQYVVNPNKITVSFKDILKRIVQERRISEDYEYVEVLETYVNNLDRQYESNTAVDKFDEPTEELREFASFLNFYSASSYKYIVETFNTPLPEHKVLCSWYVKDDDKPGLAKRAFDILRQRSSKKRLTCSLMSRDIFLTNHGWNYNQVDYGGGCNFEYTDKAVMAYVFILVSLDEGWKMPIGYIFAKCVPAESQAELIRVCLTQCDDAGVDVVAVTVDTLTPATFLGCSLEDPRNLKTTFKHPVNDREVVVWIDPCLALRSARHTLKAKEVLKNGAGASIRWNLIRKLRRLNFDDMDLDKLEFVKLRNYIVKAGLTTEIFSDSLIPALELCEQLLPNMFKDTAATRKYIEIVNTLYDILNSNTTKDIGDAIHQLDMGKEYMLGLFFNEENKLSLFDKVNLSPDKKLLYRSFVEGRPACGFIGFLICIESFKHLFTTLVEKEQRLNFLNPHQLSEDHAEDFVKDLRAHSSLDLDDFTGFAFQCYYDRVFDVLEENSRLPNNRFSLGHWRLKNKYPPAVTIKLTSGKRAFDESYSLQYRPKKIPKTLDEDKATYLVRKYSKAMDTEMDLATRKNMVGYLAGWIAARFARCLKCETCIDALCSDNKLWFHKFIILIHLKGVCLPSEEIFRICWECERALRLKTSPAKLRGWVLRRLAHRFPWRNGPPATRHHAIHHILLARAVIAKYIPLRVSAPFSSRESQRILDIYNLFSCMRSSSFFDQIGAMGRNDESDAMNDL